MAELRRIYENRMKKKLQLSSKFLTQLLYSRKAALGIELLSPETVLNMLAIKTYVSYTRVKRNVTVMIKLNE